jgi:hypothetical protein
MDIDIIFFYKIFKFFLLTKKNFELKIFI